ncbi:putative DNA polymerase I alpha catalytic subunit [Leptomonas pyrrhocoris]|uniref:DNA polymerase n=1 Tax=Leptomonas pyrrhocoris TaxID=157538 RepID=A0A0M9FXG1_LEPPY|nr:putative DNA polymerase I alpha catalytic subunit [Leptomonas pyrrhocoris]KPA78075.1 putative DNA polymerase I alpha catalytic subunit [Leptomonas pyrrhocoris]|eukprot:XP_015656514.1 putative DNA polymerase I alpha catalytic subunit [Leptomonas pyrrhocoris]
MSEKSSNDATSRRQAHNATAPNFDESQEDRWKSLREEVLASDEDAELPSSGDLKIPQLPSAKKVAVKKVRKAPALPKVQKSKQQTLEQATVDINMERLMRNYEIDESVESEDDFDVTHLLQGGDGLDNGSDDEDNGHLNAAEFLARFANAGTEVSVPVAEPKRELEPEVNNTVVKLEDESFNFTGGKLAQAPRAKKALPNDGTGYCSVDKPKQDIELKAKLAPQSEPSHLSSAASTTTKAGEMTEGMFYWFDAREQPHTLSVDPGSLFLFGKMSVEKNGHLTYPSCCVRVRNMYRSMFLLPKEGSKHADVVKEINDICRNQGIEQRRIKFVERYYAFEEPDVPRERAVWAKLRYPGRFPPLSAKGPFRHIQVIMGSSSSLLELFLIKRKLKGPCYLHIAGLAASANRISHCALEFTVETPKNIRVEEAKLPVPPFTLASIQLHAQLDSKGACNEILIASVAIYKDVNIENNLRYIPEKILTGLRPGSVDTPLPFDLESFCNAKGLPGVRRFPTERALLEWLSVQLGEIDADMMIGHNFLGFTLDTLLRRYQELNVGSWSTIGRLDLKRHPRLQGGAANVNQEKETCIGRLVVDSYSLAREHFKTVNYKLLSLAEQMQLQGITKGNSSFEPGTSTLTPAMLSVSKDVYDILLQVCNCAVLSTAVVSHLDMIRLTKRLTTIAGNLWSRTLFGARSERIEYLLLHTFHDLKFITPDRYVQDLKRGRDDDEEDEGKRKAKYQGGMVLDPKCGLYSDYILLLDFNSLYPSLIQEFNICYTTVDREGRSEVDVPPPENLICSTCASAGLSAPCLHKCVLPKVIKSLVDSRREVKRLMKSERDPNNLALLEIRQKALKLTANSMYGCLGFEYSRFHAQPLAELVTRQGRLALQSTVDLIPQLNPSLRVIYGDTDSVMIQTGIRNDIKAVRDLGLELKAKINKRYQSLEIDIDGVFRAILLLKKKKYAALTVTDWQEEGKAYKKEVKGLDMVRRDWCPLSKRVSDSVLSRVLNAEGSEDILDYVMNYMRGVAEQVRDGRYLLDDFVISKSLTKEPEAYRGNSFPHATVALRMKQRKELVRVGDLIPYVICTGERLSDKAFHVEEVRQNSQLHIDAEWYLSAQIYPPVMRLCEHIQGFSNAQLSEAMGIAYHSTAKPGEEEEANTMNDFSHSSLFQNRSLEECFPTALPLQVVCTHCRLMTPINPHARVMAVLADPARQQDRFDLYVCTSCRKSLPVDYVANCFTQTCYSIIRQFYECGGTAAAVRAVRTQFTYYRALFDLPHAPGCSTRVKDAHYYQARRCLGVDRRLYTLAEAADPGVKEVADPVDPLNAAAETIYKRIDHLFVSLDSLFAGI